MAQTIAIFYSIIRYSLIFNTYPKKKNNYDFRIIYFIVLNNLITLGECCRKSTTFRKSVYKFNISLVKGTMQKNANMLPINLLAF